MTKISSMVVLLIALRRQIVARDKKKFPKQHIKKTNTTTPSNINLNSTILFLAGICAFHFYF